MPPICYSENREILINQGKFLRIFSNKNVKSSHLRLERTHLHRIISVQNDAILVLRNSDRSKKYFVEFRKLKRQTNPNTSWKSSPSQNYDPYMHMRVQFALLWSFLGCTFFFSREFLKGSFYFFPCIYGNMEINLSIFDLDFSTDTRINNVVWYCFMHCKIV